MKNATKAMLLSAFVFPGLGHIIFKRYISSATLVGIAAIATFLILKYVVSQAMLIVDKVVGGEVEPNAMVIWRLIGDQQSLADTKTLKLAIIVLTISWLVSILDAYRLGKK